MKRIFPVVLAFLFAVLLITGCKKDDPNAIFNASFYTPNAGSKLSLYIDGTYKGVLPYFSKEPGCGAQNGDGQLPLTMQLKAGEYGIVAKDSLNRIVSSGTIRISTSKNGASGGIGGQSLSNNGDCVVVGLFQ